MCTLNMSMYKCGGEREWEKYVWLTACNAVCENNTWYEYSIAEMVLEESTHTVLSEAQECK